MSGVGDKHCIRAKDAVGIGGLRMGILDSSLRCAALRMTGLGALRLE